jgi:hypothetical protein
VKLHTNGTLILARLGKVSLRHTGTMIPRGRVDEITKEPKQIRKGPLRDLSQPWSGERHVELPAQNCLVNPVPATKSFLPV